MEAGADGTVAQGANPAYVPAPIREPEGLVPFHLNGTQDVLTLFGLMPLYDSAVRPYLRPELGPDATEADKAAAQTKRATMPRTFMHYVEGLPGKVRPPKRTGSARHAPPKDLEKMLMKPEYTYTPIVPFDQDTLASAFTVSPSTEPIPGVDLSLLEADEHETPAVKKNKLGQADRPDAPKKRVVLISRKKRL